MRRKNQMLCLQAYIHDPDFWVFMVSLALTPLVLFNFI